MKKRHHKSHHIFSFLGILVFIFIIVFGIQSFHSEYSFQEVLAGEKGQAYDEGKHIENPFILQQNLNINTTNWKTFGSNQLTFSYPGEYALRIINGNYVKIVPPLITYKEEDCDRYLDEQERALCFNPHISPNIAIEVKEDVIENPFTSQDDVLNIDINGTLWQRSSYQDEYGGQVQYQRRVGSKILQVSYIFADSIGGIPFDELRSSYKSQYQLSSVEQNKLVKNILTTINIK